MTIEISIGSDPEFLIVNKNGYYISAESMFSEQEKNCDGCNPCERCGESRCIGNRNQCGACDGCDSECDDCYVCDDCDSCRHTEPGCCYFCDDCVDRNNEMLYESEIGCDGCSDVGELRPHYSNNPLVHHTNIINLMKQLDEEIPKEYELRAGTIQDGFSLGGHIHLGIPLKGEDIWNHDSVKKAAEYISKYAGMPLRRIEHEGDLLTRGFHENGYGKFGDAKITSYGLEWRMPASWLVSSDIARSALCLTYVVAQEYMIEPKTLRVPSIQAQNITMNSTTYPTRIISQIEKMKYYSKYSKEIEPLFEMLINNQKWDTTKNILDNW